MFWAEHRNASQSLEIWRETRVRSWHPESRSPRTPRSKRILRTSDAWISLYNLLVHLHSWVESFSRGKGSALGHRAVSQSGRRYWLMMVFSMGRGVRHGNTTLPKGHFLPGWKEVGGTERPGGWSSLLRRHLEKKRQHLFGRASSTQLTKRCHLKTLAELYSLIFLLIKPSLLRCENDSRLVINCWASHYFKNDLSPKGAGVAQSTVASGSAPAGLWVFRCFGYHKKKGVMNAKCPGILNNHNSQFFFWRGEMVRSMGGNYSIVSLHIIMQREWKGHSKDPRRQKSLSFQVLWF